MKASITNIAGGRLVDQFAREMTKVLENVSDMKTKANALREITLTIKIMPDEARGMGAVQVSAKSKLAPQLTAAAILYFDHDEEGNMVAETQDPKQKELFDLKAPGGARGVMNG